MAQTLSGTQIFPDGSYSSNSPVQLNIIY